MSEGWEAKGKRLVGEAEQGGKRFFGTAAEEGKRFLEKPEREGKGAYYEHRQGDVARARLLSGTSLAMFGVGFAVGWLMARR